MGRSLPLLECVILSFSYFTCCAIMTRGTIRVQLYKKNELPGRTWQFMIYVELYD